MNLGRAFTSLSFGTATVLAAGVVEPDWSWLWRLLVGGVVTFAVNLALAEVARWRKRRDERALRDAAIAAAMEEIRLNCPRCRREEQAPDKESSC